MTTSTNSSPAAPGDTPTPAFGGPVGSLRGAFADLLRNGPKILGQFWKTERHWLFVLVPFAALAWRAGRLAWPIWFGPDSVLGFQAFVPLAAAFLVWARRHEFQAQYQELALVFPPDSPKRRGNPLLVLAGCLLFLLSCFSLFAPFAVFSLILAAAGVAYYVYGPFMFRALWQPFVFLLLSVPPVGLYVLQTVFRVKAQFVLPLVSAILRVAYPDAQSQDFTLIVHGFPMIISAVSSGALALFTIAAFAVFVAFLRRLPLLNSIGYVVVAGVTAVLINLVGVLLTALVGAGNTAAGNVLHSFVPFLLLLVSLVVVWRMAFVFRARRRGTITLAPAPGAMPSASTESEGQTTPANLDEMSEVDRIEALFRAEQSPANTGQSQTRTDASDRPEKE